MLGVGQLKAVIRHQIALPALQFGFAGPEDKTALLIVNLETSGGIAVQPFGSDVAAQLFQSEQ